MSDLISTVFLFTVIGCFLDIVARFLLFQSGIETPRWTRWVPFADVYFWWMK